MLTYMLQIIACKYCCVCFLFIKVIAAPGSIYTLHDLRLQGFGGQYECVRKVAVYIFRYRRCSVLCSLYCRKAEILSLWPYYLRHVFILVAAKSPLRG